MIFYAIVVENWKRGHDLMQNVKLQKIAGAVILILIIVIYTFYRMHDTDAVNVSVGVDEGIGEYLIIQTTEKVYVVNTINKNTTKTMYQEIQSAVGK